MSQVPAGWYPDGNGQTRYWDGSTWTEHVQNPTAAPSSVMSSHGTNSEQAVPFSNNVEESSIYTAENFRNGYYEEKSYIKETPAWLQSLGVGKHYHVQSSTQITGVNELQDRFTGDEGKSVLVRALKVFGGFVAVIMLSSLAMYVFLYLN